MDLDQKYRPKYVSDVIGQPAACKVLQKFLKDKSVPHAILFTGPSGTGKTTMARIMACEVGCLPGDVIPVSCARLEKPLETVQEIAKNNQYRTLSGKPRAYIMDEFQSLSRARFAQEGMLDVLEDVPEWSYFFLCSTDPEKILKTVRNRCVRIRLTSLKDEAIDSLLTFVMSKEKIELAEPVVGKIIEQAEGSARQALKLLQKVAGVVRKDDQLASLDREDLEKNAIDLVKALLPFKGGKPVWKSVQKVLDGLTNHDPESVRLAVLSCAKTTLFRGGPLGHRANLVIQVFRDGLYANPGKAGHAVLAGMAWEVCNTPG